METAPESRSLLSLLREIGGILTRYIGGQFRIALVLSAIYAVGFALLRVPVWPLLAAACGFSHLIPMFGPVIAILVAAVLAWISTDVYHAIGVMGVFVVAQTLEGFYLTPRILGKRLRLPALAVFIGITLAGMMFGFVGILLTVPLMAIAAAVWRFYARKDAG